MYENLSVKNIDIEIWDAIKNESLRQEDHIELIASENYTSPAVMEVQGSKLTNKYAEGYPSKRYYGGCEFVDVVERLAIERAKTLFGADYVNVQPHSGSQANSAVYMGLLEPGDCILGMSLADGGHLTHGSKVSFSGKIYQAVQYGLDPSTGLIDYDEVQRLALAHQPKMIVAGFSAYSKVVDWQRFREIADLVGAYLFVDMAHVAGLVAAGVYPSPLPFADVVTTTTHKTLRGPRGGLILSQRRPDLGKKIDASVFPGGQGGPLMHVIAAKAVSFKEASDSQFVTYQKQVIENAKSMSNRFIERGYTVVSGGTDNHLFLVSLIEKGFTGKEADEALAQANITVNKNSVPNDPQSPFITSGLRIGTPVITTRGFKATDCQRLADLICDVLDNLRSDSLDHVLVGVKKEVAKLCRAYPAYARAEDA